MSSYQSIFSDETEAYEAIKRKKGILEFLATGKTVQDGSDGEAELSRATVSLTCLSEESCRV